MEPAVRQNRLRIMYVVGMLADLEASLRAAAVASAKADFGFQHAARAAALRKVSQQLADATGDEDLAAAAKVAMNTKLKLGNGEQLNAAADEISQIAWKIASDADATALSAVDAYLPQPDKFIGKPIGGR